MLTLFPLIKLLILFPLKVLFLPILTMRVTISHSLTSRLLAMANW